MKETSGADLRLSIVIKCGEKVHGCRRCEVVESGCGKISCEKSKSAVFYLMQASYSCRDIFDIKCIQQLHEHWKFLHIYISSFERVIKIYCEGFGL